VSGAGDGAAARPAEEPLAADVPHLLTPGSRREARLSLWVLGTLGSGSLVGVASSLYLVNHHPLLLIALSPIGRHLVLVAPIVDPVAFVAVAVLRRMLFYTASFRLGRALGPAGIPWLEARAARFAAFVRWLERLFARASHLVVLLMAGPTVSALAGVSGMRPVVFTALASTSLVARMLLILGFAEWMRVYIETILAWIDEHWIPGTVLMLVLVLAYRLLRRRPSIAMED
jgi:hypothetical protein